MLAAERMGIEYLLVICRQIITTTRQLPRTDTAVSMQENFGITLSPTMTEHLGMEMVIQENRRLTKGAMNTSRGRKVLSSLQDLERRTVTGKGNRVDCRPHTKSTQHVGCSVASEKGTTQMAKITSSWRSHNILLQKKLDEVPSTAA